MSNNNMFPPGSSAYPQQTAAYYPQHTAPLMPSTHDDPVLSRVDKQRHIQRKAQILPWIANPLHLYLHAQQHGAHEHGHGKGGPGAHEPLPTTEHQAEKHHNGGGSAGLTHADTLYEEVEAEEAHPLELFYDLFFVANLTTITSVHAMTDREAIISYMLFFVILWFTWLQTTLYDIRFTNDSVFERLIRSIHFAVMIGFASVGSYWNPLDPTRVKAYNNLMSMSLTLMASRMALGVQYAVASGYAWHHRRKLTKGVVPLVLHTVTMFAAGLAYLGLYFNFRNGTGSHTWYAWYAVILVEVIAVMAASSIWKVVSFKQTHLVERLGLLTLIIIGEGIIVMLKAVNTVEKGSAYGRGWSASIFFIVACAVGILYLLYMFYFDYTPRGVHYGTIRQQFWAVLHFPFHMAIVLSVEGLRQLSTWWSFLQAQRLINERFMAAGTVHPTDTQANWESFLSELSTFMKSLYDDGTAKVVVKDWDNITTQLARLKATAIDSTTQDTVVSLANVYFDMVAGFAEFYGIKVPKKKGGDDSSAGKGTTSHISVAQLVGAGLDIDAYGPARDIMNVYNLVYTYFFSAVAVVFFMYGVLGLFVRRRKDGWDYFSVLLRWAVAGAMVGIERLKANEVLYARFLGSPWPIPAVAVVLFVAIAVDKVVGLIAYKRLEAQWGGGMRKATMMA